MEFFTSPSDLPETLRKLYLSTKFPHQEIRQKYGILRSEKGKHFVHL